MDSVRTIIVDDEQPARRGLKTLVEQHAGFTVVAVCRDGREAIARISELKPDLVLLDIQMPEITGFDVIAQLSADVMPVVIFVTAYDEYAVRAFEVRALDYVLKPVSQARFDEALARAAARVRDRRLAEYGTTLLAAVAEIQKAPEAAAGRVPRRAALAGADHGEGGRGDPVRGGRRHRVDRGGRLLRDAARRRQSSSSIARASSTSRIGWTRRSSCASTCRPS